jgi:hypothetical protein
MIRVLLSERIKKTVEKLPPDVRERAAKAFADVGAAFVNPHQHRGLGSLIPTRRRFWFQPKIEWIDAKLVFFNYSTNPGAGIIGANECNLDSLECDNGWPEVVGQDLGLGDGRPDSSFGHR